MRESTVEKALIDAVESRGGAVRKLKWVGRRGAPDRLVLLPKAAAFVELKRPKGGVLGKSQIRELDLLKSAGLRVFVIQTIEEVVDVVDFLAGSAHK